MPRYRVTGPFPVGGAAPGEVVDLELPESQEEFLLKTGHLAPAPLPVAKPKPTSPKSTKAVDGPENNED